MNVSNRKYICRLSLKTMQASRTRNMIAVCAIALTTLLFTALFTIGMSINYGFQQSNFRSVGGFSHGTFKYLNKEQYEELKEDSLIKECGLRRFVGIPAGQPFNKAHVEVGYSDDKQAHWMFCDPVEGRLPDGNTREAATDTRVLSLLGVEPKLGAEFTLTFDVDGTETTETFTLCGWWEYDEAIVASHVLIPKSRVEEILTKLDTKGNDGMTGTFNMDVMFSSSMNIAKNMKTVLGHYGYQDESRAEDHYIATGVNWGYTGAQLAGRPDPMTVLAIVGILLLIMFTGYLIIYNIFQISVTNDIRFYGLLKTIGTTGSQLRRIIRLQAACLSLAGIPIGLLLGYVIGVKMTPLIVSQLNGISKDAISTSPWIFAGAAVFSFVTVMLSCKRPGRMAAKVSPVEAVRYAEGSSNKKKFRKVQSGTSLLGMAWANLARSRGKTVVTVMSLSLAVVLLNLTVIFTNGFDMDKYLSKITVDFIVADAGYFQVGTLWDGERVIPEEVISLLDQKGGIAESGKTYGKSSTVEEFVTEEYYREVYGQWVNDEALDKMVDGAERNEEGKIADRAQLYGMEKFIRNKLKVIDGDISKLDQPGERYVAAVYVDNDYGIPSMDSHWAKVGDRITLRYIEEFEIRDPNTGEILDMNNMDEGQLWERKITKYKDVEYQVAALVIVPHTISYRYYGTDEFVMNDQTFIQDTGTDQIMYYAYDMEDGKRAEMEDFVADFTENQMPQFGYESKASYEREFESFRSMFLIMGSALSFIIGLVGILNFFNAVLTGILTRRREFAVLQSIGMTGKQLKTMLVLEGLYYAAGAVAVSLILNIAAGPLLEKALGGMLWFFTYRFTVTPIICTIPFFAVLGIVLPLAVYRAVSRHSIVERLREAE